MRYKTAIILFTLISMFICNSSQAQSELTNELDAVFAEKKLAKRIALADSLNQKLRNEIAALPKIEKIDISKKLSQIFSKDNNVGIYTWCIPTQRGLYKYYGIVKTTTQTFMLNDINNNRDTINLEVLSENGEKQSIKTAISEAGLHNGDWYGAVYYDIIEFENNNKKMYALLGNDLNGILSNKKIIDFLSFEANNSEIVFGANVLENEKQTRIIFEYNKKATMYMKYNQELEMIIYNFLVPLNPSFPNDKRFYVPDISYDGLYHKNGKWHVKEDVFFEGKN